MGRRVDASSGARRGMGSGMSQRAGRPRRGLPIVTSRQQQLHVTAVVLLCVALLDTTPTTAAHGSHAEVRTRGMGFSDYSGHQRMLLSKDNGDGINRAGEELEKIIHQRDLAMRARETYVKRKMHDMVTKPWATVHPLKLKRDETRDEALVKQAERQVKADQKLLDEAKTVSEHDKKLFSVAVARKSLQIENDKEEQRHRRKVAQAHLAAKHQSLSTARHPSLNALAHAYKGGEEVKPASGLMYSTAHAQWSVQRLQTPSQHKGPSQGRQNSEDSKRDGLIGLHSALGPSRQSMSAKFEAVHQKSLSLARLGEKHSKIYANAADEKAHHTLETLPYALPPAACLMLLVVMVGFYAVKRSQSIPGGLDAARKQDLNEIRRGFGKAAENRAEWRELGSTV